MINGVSNLGYLPPTFLSNTRPAAAAATASANAAMEAPRGGGADVSDPFREFQALRLADRQFAEMLPQIEALDVPVE
ncbi:hypothetical protein ASA1KI_44830 [Opitutales bacterium ASA1]|uniref:hypothetical protein n=1 Tax=Congregicoccus parvus TaxID=3081749 RepID=UPI002B2819AD|nr:hypothetical protein ASA1KI_44830 [Opitutales bacterium ASA1]